MAAHESKISDKGPPWWKSVRYRVAMVGFLGSTTIFIQRANLSMAIVCMVNHTAVELLKRGGSDNLSYNMTNSSSIVYNTMILDNETTTETHSCSSRAYETVDKEDGEFVWSKDTQGWLLGALFWGYVSLQVVASYLIKRIGIRHAVGPFFIVMSILTMLSQPAAMWSPWAFFALRVLIGVTNAVCLPGTFFILATWAPPEERSTLSSIIFSGQRFGIMVIYPIAGLLCENGFAGGWPSIFYISGIYGIVISFLWYLYVYDSPLKHPSITPSEKYYLLSKMDMKALTKKKSTVPWCKALTSVPFISIVISHTCLNWGLYLMLTSLPLYMREVLKFDATTNGLYAMLPYISFIIILLTSGLIFDKLTKKFGVNISRKLSALLGLGVPAMLLTILGIFDCNNAPAAVVIVCISISLLSLNFIGLLMNFFDIAPTHGGQIMTFSNTIATMPGILTPLTVAEVTIENTKEQWQKVCYITSGILGFGTLIFLIFGRVTVQKWAQPPPKDETLSLNDIPLNDTIVGLNDNRENE